MYLPQLLCLLAQKVPDTDELKSGDEKTILVWIIGVLLLAFTGLLTRYLLRERYWEEQRKEWDAWKEKAHKKMMKLALRVQKALEAWAGIEAQTDLVEDEDDEED